MRYFRLKFAEEGKNNNGCYADKNKKNHDLSST